MTAEQILADIREKGIALEIEGDQIKCKAPIGTMTAALVESIRQCKPEIIRLLSPATAVVPGHCETCPAGGFWDGNGPERWCFHSAYYLGKAANPINCTDTRRVCPLCNK